MRIGTKIPLLLQLYRFEVNMPEEKFYELTLINKTNGEIYSFEDNTWGKTVHKAFIFMRRRLKENGNS